MDAGSPEVLEMIRKGVGTLGQPAVHPALQSCGIGTFLVAAAELRIRNRGPRQAELAVEEQAPDGSLRRYETMCTFMRKELT
ncbi:GNAT family N-acetyltransferase [Streptomyces longwoodensis]|uniref:GNAT family N-acetyltransferase n=1 Tax=Streptomyces longwoodensis TaxID=68231 RepID=UPI00382998D8